MMTAISNESNVKRNLLSSQLNSSSNETHLCSQLDDELMDHEEDSDKVSTNDDSDSDFGSATDGDESPEIDEEECDRRKEEYLIQMNDLEKQFMALKDQLYLERISQLERKLDEVRAGRAQEYLQPLEELQDNMRVRTEVAAVLRDLKSANIKCQFEAEMLASKQNFDSETQLLKDIIRQDIEEKLRRLEEDRNSIDSEYWSESAMSKKKKRYASTTYTMDVGICRDQLSLPDRRRKPVTVSGPYIVYMLKDSDIMEDWNVIRRALKSVSSSYV